MFLFLGISLGQIFPRNSYLWFFLSPNANTHTLKQAQATLCLYTAATCAWLLNQFLLVRTQQRYRGSMATSEGCDLDRMGPAASA